jgi:hypothetical protein
MGVNVKCTAVILTPGNQNWEIKINAGRVVLMFYACQTSSFLLIIF